MKIQNILTVLLVVAMAPMTMAGNNSSRVVVFYGNPHRQAMAVKTPVAQKPIHSIWVNAPVGSSAHTQLNALTDLTRFDSNHSLARAQRLHLSRIGMGSFQYTRLKNANHAALTQGSLANRVFVAVRAKKVSAPSAMPAGMGVPVRVIPTVPRMTTPAKGLMTLR